MVSSNEVSEFLIKIKDVPFPTLLAGSGIILIIGDVTFTEITGKSSGLSGIGIVLVVLGLVAYQGANTKNPKKRKSKSPPG